jgi:uncharacterized alpha-E superfamily protein
MKVQFFSTLDAPMSQNKDFTLRSIMFMSGSDFDTNSILNERDVWQKVIFDASNPNSIFSIVHNARENARSIRNSISTELWESINKWYIFSKSYRQESFSSADIYSYADKMTSHIAVIKSNISNTLLHNDIWHFISLGVFIERTLQTLRILNSKISDCAILSNNGENLPLLQYQLTTLLKSLEAFDLHRLYYKGHMSKESIFEIILSNPLFPRSIQYSIKRIHRHVLGISVRPPAYREVIDAFISNSNQLITFDQFENEEVVLEHISTLNASLLNFHNRIQELYFQ